MAQLSPVIDPIWRQYEAADRRRELALDVLAGIAIGATLVAAAGAVAVLRPAHLYRQLHDEGQMFAGVGLLLAVSWVFAVIAVAALIKAAFAPFEQVHRPPLVVAGLVFLIPTSATIASIWVESFGDRCIGGC